MRRKRRALGIVLLAALAMGAVLVADAGATRSGHFTSDSGGSTAIVGHESSTHRIEFSSAGLSGVSEPIFCNNATYSSIISLSTTQEIRVRPVYSNCETTPEDSGDTVHVSFMECAYKLTSFTPGPFDPHATAGLVCPKAGEKVELIATHSGCVFKFSPQTIAHAVAYQTTVENSKHAITLSATASGINFTAHSGLCVFVGTNHTDGLLEGSATGTAKNLPFTEPVNITAT